MMPLRKLTSLQRVALITLLLVTIYTNIAQCEEAAESAEEDDIEVTTETATDVAVKDDTSLSLWSIARGVWDWFVSDDEGEASESGVTESRTFGKIRRLQMALIPLAFKFGILSAMITTLVLLTLKAVFLLKALLILNAGGLLAKLIALKHSSYNPQPYPQWGYANWGAQAAEKSFLQPTEPGKEIHVHIHNSGGNLPDQHDPYSGYSQYGTSGQESPKADYSLPYGYSRVGYANGKQQG